jgi:sugar phosphate isomerase/epimerase
MDRRAFMAATAIPLVGATLGGVARAQPALRLTPAQTRRIGATTVCWRHNMTPPVGKAFETGPKFDLLGAPRHLKDTLGLTNVEVWNYQFPDKSLDFCGRLRAAAQATGSRIINLQLDQTPDQPHDLSNADPKVRSDSIAVVKAWMDRAKALGAPSLRANIDTGRSGPVLQLGPATESFAALAQYGQSIGVKILIENHIGVSSKVTNCVTLLKAVNHPFCRAIIDWGNSAAITPEARLADLSQLFPYVDLVSAKGLRFDADYNHIDYPVSAIVRATEASGYKGIYSVELYSEPNPPADTDRAVASMVTAIANAL